MFNFVLTVDSGGFIVICGRRGGDEMGVRPGVGMAAETEAGTAVYCA